MTIELRPYQRDACAAVHRELGRVRSTLVVAATGTGKSVMFCDIARERRCLGRVLIVVHGKELVRQAAAHVAKGTGLSVAIEMGDSQVELESLYGGVDVVVASIDSIRRPERLQRFARNAFLTIVIDEADLGVAPSYRAVVDYFHVASVVGVTATADRGDKVALGHVFDSCAFRYDLRTAIRDGWLVPIVQKRIVVEKLDLSRVRTVSGDLAREELSEAVLKVIKEIAGPLAREARGRQTIAFTPSVVSAHALAKVLCEAGERAAAVDAETESAERDAVIAAYQRRELQYLINCGVFVRGFDAPETACVANARPTKSRALYAQMIGRGTRLAEGKTDCLVLDFAGNAGKHQLIGPLDVLAGEVLPEDVRKRLERDREKTGRADEMLDRAEKDVEMQRMLPPTKERTRRELASVKYAAEVVSPWEALEEYRGAGAFWSDETGEGVMRRGGCSPKQAAVLERAGYRTDLTAKQASGVIGALRENGWSDAPGWEWARRQTAAA